jgi:Ni/Fe-hydrogenase subunit HybB-like protein
MTEEIKWERTISDVNDEILVNLENPHKMFYVALASAVSVLLFAVGMVAYHTAVGPGMWQGFRPPVYWLVDITNFVFWVGIGHAGTLISAILFLFRAKWRNAVNRSAEAMTIFAVICALVFPAIHMGRMYLGAYWAMPFPNTNNLWVNFRSPLFWDVCAISTYFTVSLLFWYIGLVPDLASVRDRVSGIKKVVYGILSFGWRGTARQWHHYETGYGALAALATPLVLSVHSIVSWDFAMSLQPGWHTTIFPPYFVAGAILSGCAMVYTLLLPVRWMFQLEKFILDEHLEACIKLTLLTSTICFYAYSIEFFVAWYSGNVYEWAIFAKRATGPYAFYFWTMTLCNCIFPLIWWSKKMRLNKKVCFVICVLINVGMWFERYNIILSSLVEDFLPGSWGHSEPGLWEIGLTLGSFGLFFTFFLLFVKFFPIVSLSEIKLIMPKPMSGHGKGGH